MFVKVAALCKVAFELKHYGQLTNAPVLIAECIATCNSGTAAGENLILSAVSGLAIKKMIYNLTV